MIERVEIAALCETDAAAVLSLNNAAEPHVNALSAADLAMLCSAGTLRIVRGTEGRIEALLLTLPSGLPYESLNYRWFSDRWDAFAYVDRVVVAPGAQGQGHGRRLYGDAMAALAEAGVPRLCAEVNTRPPNPGSKAFHERLGFRFIEERENAASGKRVAMLVCPLDPAERAAEGRPARNPLSASVP